MARLEVLQTPIDAVSMSSALRLIEECIGSGTGPVSIVAANPEKVYALRAHPELRSLFREAALVLPDGIGMVLACRWLYGVTPGRVPGADLMERICEASARHGYRVFVYGATEPVNRAAVEELRRRHPGIRIAGRANGYVPATEMEALVERINASHCQVLFVGLGSPRQEQWIRQWLPKLQVRVCQAVGGTLDTLAGTVKRAPRWMRTAGLEWCYRLLRQPSRAHRQLRLLRFVAEVAMLKVRGS